MSFDKKDYCVFLNNGADPLQVGSSPIQTIKKLVQMKVTSATAVSNQVDIVLHIIAFDRKFLPMSVAVVVESEHGD